jgi:hypothetical protein
LVPVAPQAVSADPGWHVPVKSQQPVHVALQEPEAPASLSPPSPLLLEDPPPSSPEPLPEPLVFMTGNFDIPPEPLPLDTDPPPLDPDEGPATLPCGDGRPSSADVPLQSVHTSAPQTTTAIRSAP